MSIIGHRKVLSFFSALVLMFWFVEAVENKISCERITSKSITDLGGSQKTCFMKTNTSITTPDVKVSKNETIGGLDFYSNKNISYLPIKLYESFPNLTYLFAQSCSLATISKENFKQLYKLRWISLSQNKIERIPSDVFEDLQYLEWLYLRK